MAGAEPAAGKPADGGDLEPGARVRGVVIDVRGDEILVEIDGKSLGIIDGNEFEDGKVPRPGDKVAAEFLRHDPAKGAAVLSVKTVRHEIVWEELRPGVLVEGTVAAANKGGLTLDVKGVRAFLPISQIEIERVEDLTPYIGRKLRCEVTSIDRAARDVVVSRRPILEREAAVERASALERLRAGDVLTGTIVRMSEEHGAFIDLGGVQGLLHASKIRSRRMGGEKEPLRVGQRLLVEVTRLDRERGRITLDFKRVETDAAGEALQDYKVGDEVTGWVARSTEAGLVISLEDGVQGLIPREALAGLPEKPLSGAILKATVTAVDTVGRRLTLRPAAPRGK
jgi:ribosomal protein S1